MFLTLVKADAAQRLVYGRIDETPDRKGEVFDYATSKPHFEAWSDELRKASNGKSLGNLRAMHQLVAAGVVKELSFDDQAKAIEICAQVVDDAEWQKVETGTYTGFSPGGKVIKRWKDNGLTRYTAGPVEISLVDLPCIPSATFTLVKADGAEEMRGFAPAPEEKLLKALEAVTGRRDYRSVLLSASADCLAKVIGAAELPDLEKRAFSADERKKLAKDGKALPDGSFPIETRADLEDAVHAYGRAADKPAAKKHIIERAKALDTTDLLPADWEGSTKAEKAASIEDLRKGMSDVSRMADLIQSLSWLASCVTSEAIMEGDGSPLPKRICGWIADGVAILDDLNSEESAELLAKLRQGLPPDVADLVSAARIDDLAKGGSKEAAQKIHDHAVDLGAECGMAKAATAGGLAKMAGALAGARDDLAKVANERDLLKARITQLEAMPRGGGPRLKAVGKTEDAGGGDARPAAEEQLAKVLAMPSGTQEEQLAKATQLTRLSLGAPPSGAL